MKIRSITYFLNSGWPLDEAALQAAGIFIQTARSAYEAAGYTVQSARLVTAPFPHLISSLEVTQLVGLAQTLERAARGSGFDYLALGPALPEIPFSYDVVPEILATTQDVFLCGLMTLPGGGISLPAVRACARIIARTMPLTPDGFTNLRFGAIANVPPGGPFLPAAYHLGDHPAFALATEAADLAVAAVSGAASLAEARQALIEQVEAHARRLEGVARDLETQGPAFNGLDFTLAPFPSPELSFGTAMEGLGVPAVGLHGSLAAAAFLTDTLDQAQYRRVGFNGLMLPVLEDEVLAARAAQGLLTVKDLLMYAAVCGTGLDTVPLPGDTSQEQLAALLLDVAALAQRLDKPLIARLMPIPGRAAGDPTVFDFAYFANSRVLGVEAQPLTGLLAGEETFQLRPRKR